MTSVVSLKSPRARREPAPRPFEVDAIAEALANRLGETAQECDREGGHAAKERELIRSSGLLSLSVPVEYGGQGLDGSTVFRTVRRLALGRHAPTGTHPEPTAHS
jgi:alkylation response protein AidB-like acyl-CoA dehydrogenase